MLIFDRKCKVQLLIFGKTTIIKTKAERLLKIRKRTSLKSFFPWILSESDELFPCILSKFDDFFPCILSKCLSLQLKKNKTCISNDSLTII